MVLRVRGQVRGHVLHSGGRSVRQPAGYGECDASPQVARHHQLLRRVAGPGRHAGGHIRHVLQRQFRDDRPLDVRPVHVRRLELDGRVLLHRVHTAPVLHQRRQVLRHRSAPRLPADHDQVPYRGHAGVRVGVARAHIVRAYIRRLVHDRRSRSRQGPSPGRVRVRRQQAVRCRVFRRVVLGARRHHAVHLLPHLPGGRPTGANALQVRTTRLHHTLVHATHGPPCLHLSPASTLYLSIACIF